MVLPLIPLASTLIPLVADVAPSVVRFLVGDKAAEATGRVAEATKSVTEAADKVADVIESVTQTDVTTPEGIAKVRKQLEENPELKARLEVELSRVNVELERIELEREKAYLADVQNARSMALERRKAGGDDRRANIMLVSAFVAVIALVALLILIPDVPGEVAGFVIGIGGMFARNIGSAFDFEFGSSKGSKDKDAKLEAQLTELQRAARDRVDDKQREVESLKRFAKNQTSKAHAVIAAASKVDKLRELLKSS
jgi:hypothetical protein